MSDSATVSPFLLANDIDNDGGSLVGDNVMLVAWSILAAVAFALLRRLPSGSRGAWYLVAMFCVAVVFDKLADLQAVFYDTVRWGTRMLYPRLGSGSHKGLVRVLLVVPLTVAALAGTLWLVRRDRQLDRGKKLAIAGLAVVVVFVGARLLPGLGGLLDEAVCWGLEGVACVLIAGGLWLGWRGAPKGPSRTGA